VILRYYIDIDVSKDQEEAVRNAVKEWDVNIESVEHEEGIQQEKF
jgi:DNA-dependent RNA polymerase auxiliary subunit epsilon